MHCRSTIARGRSIVSVPAKLRGLFSGSSVRYFSGLLSSRTECVQLLREAAPDEAIIVVGDDYFHDNVVRLLAAYSVLSGGALRIVLFQNGQRVPIADSLEAAPHLREPVAEVRVRVDGETNCLWDVARPAAVAAWSRRVEGHPDEIACIEGLDRALHEDVYDGAELLPLASRRPQSRHLVRRSLRQRRWGAAAERSRIED